MRKPISLDDVLTADQAAAVIGISGRRVRELLLAERIRGKQVGKGVWVVLRADAEAFKPGKVGRPPSGK